MRRDGRMRKRREEHVGGGLDASVSRFPGKPGGAAVKSAPPPLSLSLIVYVLQRKCVLVRVRWQGGCASGGERARDWCLCVG